MQDIPKIYDQSKEAEIYMLWENSGFFNPDNLSGKPFTVIMPPPNANGKLHMGHVAFITPEDIIIRYQRMRGRKVLWLPGTDHAGFETQVVFEKELEKQGQSRFQMTRQEFYKACWNFVQENKLATETGIKNLGASCDWSRNMFTLDPRIVKIVYATFEQMYRDGLIYRGNRICNWCPKHQTGLSDLETIREARSDPFYYFQYGPFVIGTARPETKFGDKYVVMHPKDKRYQQYRDGQQLEVEWINGKIKATVIKDEAVDMEFGSGVMTITPAHDAVDFEIARRHGVDAEQVIDQRGKLLPIAGEFAGQKILDARPKIVEKLRAKGLLVRVDEAYQHNVQLCYKCRNLIEPQIVPQWYVAMTKKVKGKRLKVKGSLRDMAVEAVKSKKIKIIPPRFEKIYMHWMREIRDWPISRQIWWGIPIPVWYCGGADKAGLPTMGFHETIVPEVLAGKSRTYRLRDHNLKIGDRFALENSGNQTLIKYGIITEVKKTTVGAIGLPDSKHSGKYKTTVELIRAFKRLHPEKTITAQTPAWIYDYALEALPQDCGQIIIADQKPEKCPACGGQNFVQDPDTFDTWFSSGQWPVAALKAQGGAIRNSKFQIPNSDFETFYPTDVMETGWEILFFWVARMIMFGLYLTGRPPFPTVYLHGILRDKDGQKMSKSKGNVIDPKIMADKYGVDALRMAVTVGNLPGNDSSISEDKIRGYRNFANKIWNVARFVLQNSVPPPEGEVRRGKTKGLLPEDQAILRDLDRLVAGTTKLMDQYDLAHVAENLYHYFWHTFADKIIEEAKPKLADPKKRASAQLMLVIVLETCLKLLHPFTPFVTEAAWQLNHKDLLMIQSWPGKRK